MPVQKRSRERYGHILDIAEQMLLDAGRDAFKMSDLVTRSGVPFGSLYQYFPDKTAVIAALAVRYHAIEQDCVASKIIGVETMDGLSEALRRITDEYYRMFSTYPAMRVIWEATQGNKALQQIDAEQGAFLSRLLLEPVRRSVPQLSEDRAMSLCNLVMQMMACAVRYATVLPDKEADETLSIFKHGIGGFLPIRQQ